MPPVVSRSQARHDSRIHAVSAWFKICRGVSCLGSSQKGQRRHPAPGGTRRQWRQIEGGTTGAVQDASQGEPGGRAADSNSVPLLGAILGAIESLTCGTHMSVVPHVSDSMAPSNVTEPQSARGMHQLVR
jgi:hypothetical protein